MCRISSDPPVRTVGPHYHPYMRIFALFVLIPAPAFGWEFSAQPVCTLTHDTAEARLVITHDPQGPEYALSLTLTSGQWPAAPAFHIGFRGGQALTIGTGQHVLSDQGQTLTVRDGGFGNVLDGLEFNTIARAWSGDQAVFLPLEGAAPPVRAFRACGQAPALS